MTSLFPILVAAVALMPSFAFGDAPQPPLVPKCEGEPPGLAEPPKTTQLEPKTPMLSPGARVGALPGEGGVTPTGEYAYRIPIDVPPGRGGVEPSLSLAYNSRGANGYLGVGWHLDGLSEIAPCPKTVGAEDLVDGVFLNHDDALCIDGRKLVRIGAFTDKETGCAGDEYRTEEDSFARIASCYAGGSDQAARFTVWTKDGRIRRYDPMLSAGPADEQRVIAWPMAQEGDRSGNVVSYNYAREESGKLVEYYPISIEYTRRAGEPGRRLIKLIYKERADKMRFVRGITPRVRTWTPPPPMPGFPPEPPPAERVERIESQVTKRLTAIEAYAPRIDDVSTSELAWTYELTYQPDAAHERPLHRSRLSHVRKCGPLGGCQLRKRFTWESRSGPEFVETISPLTPQEADNYFGFMWNEPMWPNGEKLPLIVADLDGDGRDELALGNPNAVSNQHLRIRKTVNREAPLAEHFAVPMAAEDLVYWEYSRIADLDGDGRDEIVAPDRSTTENYGSYRIFELQGSLGDPSAWMGGTPLLAYQWTWDPGPSLHLADLDGDGLADLLYNYAESPYNGPPQPGTYYDYGWTYQRNLGSYLFGPKHATYLKTRDGDPAPLVLDTGHRRPTVFVQQVFDPDYPGLKGFRLSPNGSLVEAEEMSTIVAKDGDQRVIADISGDGFRDDVRLRPNVEWVEPTVTDTLRTVKHTARLFWPSPNSPTGPVGPNAPPEITFAETTIEVDQMTGVSPGAVASPTWDTRVVDIDGDGREDIVVTYTWLPPGIQAPIVNRVFVVSFDGEMFSRELAVKPPRAMGDFDGDGLIDLVAVDGVNPPAYHIYRQVGPGHVDRIVAVSDEGDIANPDHAREKIVYSNAFSPEPTSAECQHPQRCMKHGFAVVREHDVYRGHEVTSYVTAPYLRTLYNYEDPRFNVHGQGFLGFGVVRSWEVERHAETTTTYDHETPGFGGYPIAMRPSTIQRVVARADGSDARVSQTSIGYEVRPLNNGRTHAVFPTSWSSHEWDQTVDVDTREDVNVHITGVRREEGISRSGGAVYDDFGNKIEAWASTMGGVTTHVVSTYEVREEDWLVSLRRTTETTSAETPSVTRHVAHDYDKHGFLCHTYVEKDNPSPEIPEVFTYFRTKEGLIRAVTATAAGEAPRTTHVAYEPDERVYPVLTWNDLGHTQSSLYHPAHGVLLAQSDENEVETNWQYDDLGRPITTQRDGAARAYMRYAPRESAQGDIIGANVEISDDAGGYSSADYDELGRVVAKRHLGFDGSVVEEASRYDIFGRLASKSRPGKGVAAKEATTFTYDHLGRLARQVRPSNEIVTSEITEYQHTILETHVTDPMGHARHVTRDVDGRTVSVVEGTLETTYQYGDFGQLHRTHDPHGNAITVGYDARGRRRYIFDPDAGSTTMHYNGFGDLKSTTANGAHLRTFVHDAIGRVRQIDDDDGSTFVDYDLAPHGIGRVSHTASPDGTLQDFEYDTYGRPSAETWTVEAQTFRFDRSYDQFGRLQNLAYPQVPGSVPWSGRFQVTHEYNAQGYLSFVGPWRTLQNGTIDKLHPARLSIEKRNLDGALVRANVGDSNLITRTYNPDTGRLLTMTSGSAVSLEYGYDLEGQIIRRKDNVQGRLDVFSYDDGAAHRLTGFRRIPTSGATLDVGYGYDDLGNLTQVFTDGQLSETHVYGEDHRPHTLTSNASGAFIYDDRGRQELAPGRQVTYTEFDLPRSVITASGSTSFLYDAANQRVKKSGPGGTTVSLGGLYERRTGDGFTKHIFYVRGPEGPFAQVTYVQGGNLTTEYLHTDALGSIAAVSDHNGTVTEPLDYEPFGARRDTAGNPTNGTTGDVKLSFAGHRHDDEIGLIDMRGRVYDPTNRRFLTPDPHVTNPLSSQSYNRYSYVFNNPINMIDPTGFDGEECPGCTPTPPQPEHEPGSGGPVWTVDGGGSSGGGGQSFGYGAAPSQHTEHVTPTSLPVGPSAPMGPLQAVQTNWLGAAAEAAFDVIEREQTNGLKDLLMVFAPGLAIQKFAYHAVEAVRTNGVMGVVSLHPAYKAYQVLAGAWALGDGIGNGDPKAIGAAVAHLLVGVAKGAAGGIAAAEGSAAGELNGIASGGERFFRTMTRADAEQLRLTGKVPATRETFISPCQAYSCGYDGVLVEFALRPGTTAQLVSIGVRDGSALTRATFPGMPSVSKGWAAQNAFFKGEGNGLINIGLGRGLALDIFNQNILRYNVVRE